MKLLNLLFLCSSLTLISPIITKATITPPTPTDFKQLEQLQHIIELRMITCTKYGIPLTDVAKFMLKVDPAHSMEQAFTSPTPFGKHWYREKYINISSLFENNHLSPLNQAIYVNQTIIIFLNNDDFPWRAKKKYLLNIITILEQLIMQSQRDFDGYFSPEVAQ